MLIEFTHKNGNLIFTLCLQNHTKNIKIGFMRLKTLKKLETLVVFHSWLWYFLTQYFWKVIARKKNKNLVISHLWADKNKVFVYVMFAISDQHANNI